MQVSGEGAAGRVSTCLGGSEATLECSRARKVCSPSKPRNGTVRRQRTRATAQNGMPCNPVVVGTLLSLTILGGCGIALQPSNVTTLRDGQKSVMDAASNNARESLMIDGSAPPINLHYSLIKGCLYDEVHSIPDGSVQHFRDRVSIKAIKDKLFMTSTDIGDPTKISAKLMDYNGKVYDFNDNYRVLAQNQITPENLEQESSRIKAMIPSGPGTNFRNPHVTKSSTAYPEYSGRQTHVGGTVAVIRAEDDSIWASYIYRGTTQFRGRYSAVYDLERHPDANPNATFLVGFDVVDEATAMPLLSISSSGFIHRQEQASCEP